MILNRRQFIYSSIILGTVGAFGITPWLSIGENQCLISAYSHTTGRQTLHFVGAFNQHGEQLSHIQMPDRCHQVLPHPHKVNHVIALARRPGKFIAELDLHANCIKQLIELDDQRHTYGHGIFTADGDYLIYGQRSLHEQRGLITISRSDTYQVVHQFDSGGIGPHELVLHPDQQQLIIANGGISTTNHPSRFPQNLDSMQPNLSYLDLATGSINQCFELDNHQLSIRHLAVSQQGQVIAGLQYQGAKNHTVPLAFSQQHQQAPQYLQAPSQVWRDMQHYTASVVIDDTRQLAIISCPRGNLVTNWHLPTKQWISSENRRDCAGLAMLNRHGKQHLAKSSGDGHLEFSPTTIHHLKQFRFDNHLSVMNFS